MKNILLIAASSDIAKSLIELLSNKENKNKYNIFATYRKPSLLAASSFTSLVLDICDDNSFLLLNEKIKDIKFDAVINFAGIAITSPVSKLNPDDLALQFDVSTVGLARFLKFIYPFLNKNSKVINLSSMASFGIFPFISPYCAAKAAGDILLNSFEIETGIPCISIKPGVVSTKFWQYCIDLNESNFKNFDGEYEDIGKFLLKNAKKNANKGVKPDDVAKVILKALNAKNPKKSYLIGADAYFASLSRFIPKNLLNTIIRYTLKKRVRKSTKNEQ